MASMHYGIQWGSWKHIFALRPFHLCIYLNFERCYLLLVLLEVTLIKSLLRDAQKSETTRSLEEIVRPTSDSSVAMSSPLIVLEIFWISRTKHFIQLRTWWGSFQTWSQHINDLHRVIEVCWVSHNLWRKITLFLKVGSTLGHPTIGVGSPYST
jgi:hypothetical protein